MLTEILIEQIGIFERAYLKFGGGFTSVTGETGAGKSLLVQAIGLCLGARADLTAIRSGEDRATVSAVFEPTRACAEALENLGIEIEDGKLYVQREVAAEGRSQCRINGRPSPVSTLKLIGEVLADLHGQHEHQSLLDVSQHIQFLDLWIGEPAASQKAHVDSLVAQVSALREELSDLADSERDRAHEIDLLRFQVAEIETAEPQPGETDRLLAELKRLQNIDKLRILCESAFLSAYGDERSATESLTDAAKHLEQASELDGSLTAALDSLSQARYSLEAAVDQIRDSLTAMEVDERTLDELQGRIETLLNLKRKYGRTEQEIVQFCSNAKTRLQLLENAEANLAELSAKLELQRGRLEQECKELSAIRKDHAERFSKSIEAELSELAMPGARLTVNFSTREPTYGGSDQVEFLFSANKGEELRPLYKIASGGEISRVSLAIKTILAGRDGVSTLIFDEVDAGLGGEASLVLGKKLARLSKDYQVIVITHMPQVAAHSDVQLSIRKREVGGRTLAEVDSLDSGARAKEVARMLAGDSGGDHALRTAHELLSKRGN